MKIIKVLSFIILTPYLFIAQSDGCSSATTLPVSGNCSSPTAGTTTGATQSITGCVGNADDDVWYQFTATNSSHEITVVGSTGFDAVIQLLSGACSALVSVQCEDQTFSGGTETLYATGLTPGNTYKIRVYHYLSGSGSGNFTICVTTPPPPPSNDICGNATGLIVNSTCSYTSSTSASATQSFAGCSGTADDDVWFSFVATNSVQDITVDPSSNMDPVVQLYSGSCSTLNSLYCEDATFTNGTEVINAVGLVTGNTYFVRVYDYYSSTGGDNFDICVTGAATAVPSNDEPCNAIPLPAVTAACNYLNFTTVGATPSVGAPTPSSCIGGSGAAIGGFTTAGTGTADVWFSVTVPASGSLYITPQPNYGISDGVMVLYSGTCGSLTQLVCSDDNNYPGSSNDLLPYISQTGLTPGSTVYIRYFGFGTSAGDFGLCVTSPTNDDCTNALYICDINGYSASTSAAYSPDRPCNMHGNNETSAGVNQPDGVNTGGIFGQGGPWGTGSPLFDVNIENNSWIEFTAGATTATLSVTIYDCWVGSYPSGGIQMQIFQGTNCCSFVPVSNFEESSTAFTITANNLTVGQNYYLMVDGYNGDICNYTINATSGVLFPDIVASADPICSGAPVTLTAPSGATGYTWLPGGQTTQSITVNPSTTTTYTCIVEGVCGFKQTLTHTTNVNQLPNIISSPVASDICSGSNVNYNINSDLSSTYTWIASSNTNVSGESITTQTGNTINDVLSISGTAAQSVTYSITPTSSAGCVGNPYTVSVDVNPIPAMTSATTDDFCSGGTANIPLSSSVPSSYSWIATNNTNVTGESLTAQNSSTINNTLVNTSTVNQVVTYSVTPTSTTGSCVGAAQQVNVTVYPSPGMTSTNTGTICSGENVGITLTSNLGSSYTWSATNNTNVSGESTTVQNSSFINDQLDNNSTTQQSVSYSVTPTSLSNSCIGANQTVTVLVDPLPNMTSTNTDNICSGSTLNISLSSDISANYSWVAINNTNVTGESTSPQTGNTINNTLVNTTSTNQIVQYSVTPVSSSGSCTGPTQTVNVTVYPAPNMTSNNTATICDGNAVNLNLTADLTSSFTWVATNNTSVSGESTTNQNSSTISDIIINGTSSAQNVVYTVTPSTTSNSCTGTPQTVTVTVNPTPNVAVNGNITLDCNNPTDAFTASGGTTYSWSTPDGTVTGSAVSVDNTSSAGAYTVTGTALGCTADASGTLTLDFATPNAAIATAAQINCTSPSIQLDGTSSTNDLGGTTGLTYNWSGSNGGNVVSGSNTANPTVNSAGDYTLTVTQANGCTDVATVTVTADASVPSADAGINDTLNCAISSVSLDGSNSTGAGLSYSWTTSNGNIVSGNNSTTPSVDAAGTYVLEITASNGCTNTDQVIITLDNNDPTVNITGLNTVDCNNTTITLDGSGSSQGSEFSYQWYSNNGGNITSANNLDQITVNLDGDYVLVVTDNSNACIDSLSYSVAIDTLSPTSEAGAVQTLTCAVTSVNLDGSASAGTGISYSWNGAGIVSGATTSTPTVNQTGWYQLTVTGTNGCADLDSVEVVPDANAPVADAGITQVINCNNTTITLDGSGSASGASISYNWNTTDGNIVSGGNTNSPIIDLDGTYSITVSNSSNGCTASDQVIITIDTTSPNVIVNGTNGLTTIDCNNTSLTLDGSASTGTGLTYSWSTADGNIVSGSNSSMPIIDQDGTYDLTVTGANGCSNNGSIVITVDTVVPVLDSLDVAGSLNCNNSTTVINAYAQGTVSYIWTTQNGSIVGASDEDSVQVDAGGVYTVIVIAANGCTNASTANVTTVPNPIADFNASPDNGTVPLEVSYLNNSTGNGLSYSWNFGNGLTDTIYEPNTIFNDFGEYTTTLIVTDSEGCTDTAEVIIIVDGEYEIVIPNIFTPNGDDDNDVFSVTVTNAESVKAIVYNRWGQLLYEWDGTEGGWDGRTTSGLEASEGTYFYLIEVIDFKGEQHAYQGHFELRR